MRALPICQRSGVAIALALGCLLSSATAAPALELRPGESATVSQSMTVPALPPKLDFVLLMDATGSMTGEINNAKSGAGIFFDAVRADSPDSAFAVASFEDYPYSTYGNGPALDRPYRRLSDLTAQKVTWQTAVNSIVLRNGGDTPEAQVPALFAAVTGQGLSWPGGMVPGQGISFRTGAAHFIALVSDAGFHNDKSGSDPYTGFVAPTYAEAVNALSSGSIRVIAADSHENGATPDADMSTIAADTGGAYYRANSLGTGLWTGNAPPQDTGISGALRAARYPVTAAASCAPLEISLNPGSWADVAGNSALPHDQTITVPAGVTASQLPPGGRVDCSVAYTWGEVFIGERHVEVQVILPTPPGGAPGGGSASPSSAFSIGRTRINAARGTATLALTVPGSGKLDVLATASTRARASTAKRIRVARVRRAVTRPGTVRVTLTPSRAARRILKRKRRLKIAVKVTFTPTGGRSGTRTRALTLRLRPARR